jgi:hypothetical protein
MYHQASRTVSLVVSYHRSSPFVILPSIGGHWVTSHAACGLLGRETLEG